MIFFMYSCEERHEPVPAGAPQGLCTAQSQTGLVRLHTDARSVTTPEPHLRRSPSLAPESATHGAGPAGKQPHDPSPVPAQSRPGPQQASPVGSPGQQQVVRSQERNCRAKKQLFLTSFNKALGVIISKFPVFINSLATVTTSSTVCDQTFTGTKLYPLTSFISLEISLFFNKFLKC